MLLEEPCDFYVRTCCFYTVAYKCAVVCWYYPAACVAVGAQVLTWCLSDTPMPTVDSCTCNSRMTTVEASHFGFPTCALNGVTKTFPASKQKCFCFPATSYRIHLSSRSDKTTGLCVLSRPVQCRTERLLWGQSGALHNSRCLRLRWAHSPSHTLCGLFSTVRLNMDQLAFRHTALFNPHNLSRSCDGVLHTCCEEQCALRRNRLVKTAAHRAGTRSEQAAPWCWFLS